MCLLFNSFKEHILNTQQTLGTVLGAQNRKIRHTFIFFLLIFKNMFGYPGLCCCTRAFSSCGKQGLLSCCGTWFLGCRSSVVAHELSSCSAQAYQLPCGMWNLPGARDRSHIPYIGRQILNHWTTREVQLCFFEQSAICWGHSLLLLLSC